MASDAGCNGWYMLYILNFHIFVVFHMYIRIWYCHFVVQCLERPRIFVKPCGESLSNHMLMTVLSVTWHKNHIVLSALWCFDFVSFHSNPPGLLNCHLDNRAFLPVQVKQSRPHYVMHICAITIPLHMCVRYFHTIVSTGHLICRYNRPDIYKGNATTVK